MKKYIQPSMVSVKLQHQGIICTSSVDAYGMNSTLQDDEVDEAWTKESSGGVWDNEW